MSLLSIAPDIVTSASGNLENLGSGLRGASAAAAAPTTAIAAPAADEVSAAITALFGTHGQEFQALSAKAATFHDDFVNLLNGGAAQYVSTELTNAQQTLTNAVNAPAQALLGHPLIGTGQGTAGAAAANPADTIYPGFSQSYNFGPFQVSLTQTGISYGTGGILGTTNGSLTLNTPLGSAVLLSGNGIEVISPNGSFLLSALETTPLYYVGASATGVLSSTTIQLTGLTLDIDGLDLSFPGEFGFLPNVSWSPTP